MSHLHIAIPAVSTPAVYSGVNAMQDAIRDFVAVTLHSTLSHGTMGAVVTVITVTFVYAISRAFHIDER